MAQVDISEDLVGQTYGELFACLTLTQHLIPLGLYRRYGKNLSWLREYLPSGIIADVCHSCRMGAVYVRLSMCLWGGPLWDSFNFCRLLCTSAASKRCLCALVLLSMNRHQHAIPAV